MAELTPMMRQYMEIKEQNPDSILFFRLGDFYEMFGPDARTASRELDLALTTRDKDKTKSFDDKIPMCGIPYHASDAYIARYRRGSVRLRHLHRQGAGHGVHRPRPGPRPAQRAGAVRPCRGGDERGRLF